MKTHARPDPRLTGAVSADDTLRLSIDALLRQKKSSMDHIFITRRADSGVRFALLTAEIVQAIRAGAFHAIPGWACSLRACCPLRVGDAGVILKPKAE